jgi:hypothetical protein
MVVTKAPPPNRWSLVQQTLEAALAQRYPIPKSALAPYAMIALVSGLPVLIVEDSYSVAGYGLFASLNSLIYSGLLLALLCLHIRENR